jgi:cytochrome c-type biogenesis protein CcmH/NrfF
MTGAAFVLPFLQAILAAGGSPKDDVVRPFLETWKGKLAPAGAESALRSKLRIIARDVPLAAAKATEDAQARRKLASDARDALVQGLAAEMGGADEAARAEAAVKEAWETERTARIDGLEHAIICWCRDEDWTRLLAGCADACSGEQKHLIRDWVDGGMTDEEVIARMVAHPKGGPKVRAVPVAEGTTWIAYLFPAAALVAGASVVVFLIRAALRKGKGSAPAGVPEDDGSIEDAVEKELREMEG